MNVRLIACLAVFLVGACLPVSTYYRVGVSPSRLLQDTTACEVRALRDAPVALRTEISPPVWVPARRVCTTPKSCTTQPGYYRQGHVYQVDVNKALRGRVESQCMSGKGYSPVQIPACQNGAATVPVGGANRLPQLTDRSCAMRNPDGTLRVLNQD